MSPPDPAAPPAAPPAVGVPQWTRLALRLAAGLAISAFTLLLVAWLALHWAILPQIDRWRPQIERQASDALGVKVVIASIAMRSGGWVPVLELRGVKLLDAAGQPALELGHVVATLSPRSMAASLANLELRLSQLLIEGARLEVRRSAEGQIFVAGLALTEPDPEQREGAADWILHQGEIAIRGATLRWSDELRGAPPLELSAVDLVLRNSLRRHRMRLDATPPPDWGQPLHLRAEFDRPLLARSAEWRRWSGEAFLDAPRADAKRLGEYIDLPFEIERGEGALRIWIELHEGTPQAMTLDAALRAAEVRLAAGLEPIVVAELEGRFEARRRTGGGRAIALRGFGFVDGEGRRWPKGDVDLAWRPAAGSDPGGGEFRAARLDLELLAQTATRLPLGAPLRRLLGETQPRGIASEVRASWSGPLDAPQRYSASARLAGLAIASQPPAQGAAYGRPGLSGAEIAFEASEKGGKASFAIKDGTLDFPGVFAEPVLPFTELRAAVEWDVEAANGGPPELQLRLRDAVLANDDARAEFEATWASGRRDPAPGARQPGRLELEGTLTQGVASRVARYLPLRLPETVRSYVLHAIQGGTIRKASFRVAGDLRHFPRFGPESEGEFRVVVAFEDLGFAYVPGAPGAASPWPALAQARGELVFDRVSFEFRDVSARLFGVELSQGRGRIRSFVEQPLLELDLVARGPLADMLRFVQTTPAGEGVGDALAVAQLRGDGELSLGLKLPLRTSDEARVKGSLSFAGNDLRLNALLPQLSNARGRVDFSERGLAAVDARGTLLGGEVAIEGKPGADGVMRLALQGRASAEALRQTGEQGAVSRFAGALSGQANYRLALALAAGGVEFDLTSDLAGLASALPPPLAKPAETALPLRLRSERGAAAQENLTLELGTAVRANFVRDHSGSGAPRVVRGGIGVNAPAPAPAAGVAARLALAQLDLQAWEAAAARYFPPGGAASESAWLPERITLEAKTLAVAGQKLNQVNALLTRDDATWRAEIDAEQLAGRAEYRPSAPGQPGRVYARLARLALERNEADDVSRLLDRQPASVPALDIVVEQLRLRGRDLGRLEVQAVNRGAPEKLWDLQRFALTLPEARLAATGRWVATPGVQAPRRAQFDYTLDVDDGGALLRRLGHPDAIRGGKGRLEGNVAWLGSPLQPDFESMTGDIKVAFESGQFLPAQPGAAARLLSVLSLQGLLRRLSLDFRDLSQEGFAFDTVRGDIAIAGGVASTNDLVMRGAQAMVLLEGSADARNETQDLRVLVIPEINLGAASLAYSLINPVVGLSTFAAQLFLREPLAQASAREYRILGSWSDPQIEEVERRSGQALPRIAPLPGAAGSAPATPGSQ